MNKDRFRKRLWASWIGFITIFAIWQIIVSLKLINPVIFPGPVEVIRKGLFTIPVTNLLENIGISLFRVIIGFILGLASGVILGVFSGWYRRLGNILRAPIELIRPIPPLAWIPISIIWLGIGEPSKVLIIFLGAFFPIFTNTLKGMLNIEPNIIRAGQILGLKSSRLLFKVAIPSVLPDIATGIRVGWSYSFGCMVAAELIAAESGLGYLIMSARELGQIAMMMFGIILIGVINLATDYLIQEGIIKKQLSWAYSAGE